MRIAVVGSGPSGLYAAVDALHRMPDVHVDLFDRLPTPGGLVRFGVAPDHHDRRGVASVLTRMAMATGRFRFLGNVEVGRDVSVDELGQYHEAVVYSYGAAGDRGIDVPGSALPGSHAAVEFVGWYNGHPDYAEHTFELDCDRAVVIGNGNVALDIARLLVMSPDALAHTDIADHALEVLSASSIREVVVLGRRGPLQAAYTGSELLALGDLGVDIVIEADGVESPSPETADWRRYPDALKARVTSELMTRPRRNTDKRIVFRYLCSPIAIFGPGRVAGLQVMSNRLTAGPQGSLIAEPTGEVDELRTGLVFRSIGYRGEPLAGLPFDERSGTIPNDGARVIDPLTERPIPGAFVAGWIKRGPTGVIGTNKACAHQTIDGVIEDRGAGRLPEPALGLVVEELLAERNCQYVSFEEWSTIDRHERLAGKRQGRPRRKVVCHSELIALAHG